MELNENQSMLTGFVTLVMLICGILVLNIKQKKLPWYLLLLIFFTPLFWVIVGSIKSENPTKKTKIISYLSLSFGVVMFIFTIFSCNPKQSSESRVLGKSFTEILIENDLSTDIKEPNKFESLRSGNRYSNHYFNFSTIFPEGLEIDRGNSKYSIISGIDEDYGVSISINVVPGFTDLTDLKIIENHKSFQKNPLQTMNKSVGGDFSDFMVKQLNRQTGISMYNFIIGEKKIRTTNYLTYQYNYNEIIEDTTIEFIMSTYQTILWGNTFTLNYSTPIMFYDKNIVENILESNNYIKPLGF